MSKGELLMEAGEVRHAFGEGLLRKEVLHGVSCSIHAGEIVLVTGPSGSGKTTFLTLIGALRGLQQGSIRLFGKELREATSQQLVVARRSVGFIFQQHHLIPALSARENVQMPLAHARELSLSKMRERAMELLSSVGMEEYADQKPAQLSGGQRQRVAIARALAGRPRMILADEPTSSLDGVSGREVVKILESLARKENCAVILVTHDSRILDVADRIIHLEDGELEESDLRFDRVWSNLAAMASTVAGFMESVRPGEMIAPALDERRAQFREREKATQADLTGLKQLGSVHSAAELNALYRLLGELESLSEAVGRLALWFTKFSTMPQLGAGEFEAVEAILLILAEAVGSRDRESLDLVISSTQRGNSFMEKLLERSAESAATRVELLTLVAPVMFLARSVAEKTAAATPES